MSILTYRSVTNYYLQLDVHELAGDLPWQVVERRALLLGELVRRCLHLRRQQNPRNQHPHITRSRAWKEESLHISQVSKKFVELWTRTLKKHKGTGS